ncbi:MAG: hypothetical protein ACTHZD_16115 [Micrococcaceae bacterium]
MGTQIELANKSEVSTIELAERMAGASILPRQYQKQPANLLFAFEYADALGIPRINAITAIHVIEGKPSASADLIASLVRKAGHKLRVSGDDTRAVAQIIRADDPEYVFEVTWDMQRAKNAKLTGKDNWSKYPAAMLKARAITEVARMAASEALYGVIYTPEELGEVVDEDGNPVNPTRPTPPAPGPAAEQGGSRIAQARQRAQSGGRAAPAPEPEAAEADAPATISRDQWDELKRAGAAVDLDAKYMGALAADVTGLDLKGWQGIPASSYDDILQAVNDIAQAAPVQGEVIEEAEVA